MKRILLSVILFCSVVTAMAQKTIVNDANAEKREAAGFNAISVSHGIDLYLSQGDAEGIAVSATEKKYRDKIRTEVIDGTLKIWYDKEGWNWTMGNHKLRAYVSFKSLKRLHASGASDVFVESVLKSPDLELVLSGASDFKGALDVDNLNARVSGASDIAATGKAGNLTITASGASSLKSYDLVVQTCDAEASGASEIKITVEKELSARASGASDIHMKGNGVIKKLSTSGASNIKKA